MYRQQEKRQYANVECRFIILLLYFCGLLVYVLLFWCSFDCHEKSCDLMWLMMYNVWRVILSSVNGENLSADVFPVISKARTFNLHDHLICLNFVLQFDDYYSGKFSGRKLTWLHNYCHGR